MKTVTQKIEGEVLTELMRCSFDGNQLRMAQMDRALYVRVNKVLELLGGKWTTKLKAHVFPQDAAETVTAALMAGEVVDLKKTYQYFPTPPELAEHMADLADLTAGDKVLEPSAGTGNIVKAVIGRGIFKSDVTAVELNPDMAKALASICGIVYDADFLKAPKAMGVFDRIVMNPPFTGGQDVDHIRHAWNFLGDGGKLVAIASPGWQFRQDRKFTDFREWLNEHNAEIEDLSEGTFQASGTMVRATLLTVQKD